MTNTVYGIKYNSKLSTKDIASIIRQEIKEEIKQGNLPKAKYSVRKDSYNAIRVYISNVQSPKLMFNPHHILFQKENPSFYTGNLPIFHEARERYTPEGKRVLAKLETMLQAYNYDGSDSQSDYFNVNFYATVQFDWEWRDSQNEMILAHMTEVA